MARRVAYTAQTYTVLLNLTYTLTHLTNARVISKYTDKHITWQKAW